MNTAKLNYMNNYIPESSSHYALCYVPFMYSTDPEWGLIAFLKAVSDYLQKLKSDSPSFNRDAKWLSIESEESDKTFGVIELGLEDFIFAMMDKEIFQILSTKLCLKVYRKEGDIGTSKFSANELIGAIEGMIRQMLIDQVLQDLD